MESRLIQVKCDFVCDFFARNRATNGNKNDQLNSAKPKNFENF